MYDFKFADIGEGVHEGVILKWNFKQGDKVKEGETLVEIETDKVNAEIPAPVDGTLEKLGAQEGETINVGETLVLINDGSGAEEPKKEEKQEEVKEEKQEAKEEPKKASVSEEDEDEPQGVIGEIEVSGTLMAASNEHSGVKKESTSNKRVLATPVARQMAKDLGVDIKLIDGSGENGRILKEDIQKAAESKSESKSQTFSMPNVKVSTDGDVELVKISKLRKAIVNAMTVSKQVIPHTVLMDDVVVDKLVELRAKVKEQAAAQDIKLTYMAFVMKATILALKKFPMFNASFDQANEQMVVKKFYNIGMAVDTKDGLIVPNIKNADKKSILELAKEIREVADLTVERKIQLDQLRNSTFSISNFGAANVAYGTPIINHPEVGILGIGKIEKKAVVVNDEIKISYVLPLSLAVDHRVIDGADAGRFLNEIKALLSDPMMLLLS